MAVSKINRKIRFLEVKSGICAPAAKGRTGAELGIDAIKIASVFSANGEGSENGAAKLNDFLIESKELINVGRQYEYARKNRNDYFADLKPKEKENTQFARHIKYLVEEISDNIIHGVQNELDETGAFPIVLAGDHSTACLTIAGIKSKYKTEKLGVIWIDAHADLHSPFTTPSGNMHGMPAAVALGLNRDTYYTTTNDINIPTYEQQQYWDKLCNINGECPMVEPENFVYIGIRDLEDAEWDCIKNIRHGKNEENTGIKHFHLDKTKSDEETYIENIGISIVCKETIEYLNNRGCERIYLSFDIDAIDCEFAPGTGTPVPNGFSIEAAKKLLFELYHEKTWEDKLVAMEFVEINPLLDIENKTAKVVVALLKHIL